MNGWRRFRSRALLFTIVCIGCARGDGEAKPTSATAPQSIVGGRGPILVCANPVFDFGKSGESFHEHTFRLRNTSRAPATISAVGTSCNCTAVALSHRTIPPGEYGEVRVSVDMNKRKSAKARVENFRAEALIHIAETEGVAQQLVVQGMYLPPVMCDTSTQRYRVDAQGKFSYRVDVKLDTHDGVDIIGVQLDARQNAVVGIERDAGDSERYETVQIMVDGTVSPETTLPVAGQLTVWTNNDATPEIVIPIVLEATESQSIQASPDKFAFGVIEAGQRIKRTSVISWPASQELTVAKVTSSLPQCLILESKKLPERGGRASIIISCELQAQKRNSAIDAEVRVVLQEEGAPGVGHTVTLPASAFVKDVSTL